MHIYTYIYVNTFTNSSPAIQFNTELLLNTLCYQHINPHTFKNALSLRDTHTYLNTCTYKGKARTYTHTYIHTANVIRKISTFLFLTQNAIK